ncbi:MAG TPA: hypothetical protein VE172_16465 [Stackebrandtia sp.]|jgi:hypothetical protein|uniref:hypothetical protein n=1 Tax=Stackebrandtia sp. TaxID=2023065 RepID=UPI002D5563EE|nr:hypothetical protein [Stackebrandtia sp.]HZE40396.1 hypothetical protein [Stackebrandtia sp.]
MSDIETLGATVRGIAAELPVPNVELATDKLNEAHAGLTAAMRESIEPAGVPRLSQAREHVDAALRKLRSARSQLDDYLESIGVSTVKKVDESPSVNTSEPAVVAPGSTDWWRQRVNAISEGDARTEPGEVTVTKLFSELVDAARRGDRDAYRDRLLVAGASGGSRLPGLSWPMIRGLASDILGHSPTTRDDDRLRGIVRADLAKVLPKIPADVALAQLHGACSLPHEHRDAEGKRTDAKPHPVDAAAAGPVVVASLLREREKTRKDS